MRHAPRNFTALAIAISVAGFPFAGPSLSAEWPGIREAKTIAEEGFIYGLPLVMNYAVKSEAPSILRADEGSPPVSM